MLKNIEFTEDEVKELRFFLMISTKYRECEEKACRELSKDVNEDGILKYPNMIANAEIWKRNNAVIENIIEKLW